MVNQLLQNIAQLGEFYKLPATWLQQRPHLFSPTTLTLSALDAQTIQATIAAIEQVVTLPAYQQHVLAYVPPIAQFNPGNPGVLFGYDFHLTAQGPKLIEINTNAGGAFLVALLDAATNHDSMTTLEKWQTQYMQMFLAEWHSVHAQKPLQRIAIVDDTPEQQFLYPEFLILQAMAQQQQIDMVIAAPEELSIHSGILYAKQLPVDLVYNRTTDFYFADPQYQTLRAAYQQKVAVITPHPHAHALYANKANLITLSDRQQLTTWGIDKTVIDLLQTIIPTTFKVNASNAQQLWEQRKQLFFKPLSGYGSKGVYRGDKLTHRVFNEILTANYIAQTWEPPSEHRVEGQTLKADIRAYVYAGQIQNFVARLYQGQTTNFRSLYGGFAKVVVE